MVGRKAPRAAVFVTLVLVALAGAAPVGAAPPENLSDDGNGKRWRQLTQTTGVTPDQVAQVCPRDGETRCSGSVGSKDLTGWVWSAVRGTSSRRWTSSTEADGRPTFASAGFGWYPIAGSFGVGPATNPDPIQYYGVWMWRPAGDDITPPTIAPTVSGTTGKNGWYVSDVTVTWDVRDGNDWIDGGASPDDLNGGNGDDFLDGGLHNDSLRGDNGRDTCRSGEVRMSSCER